MRRMLELAIVALLVVAACSVDAAYRIVEDGKSDYVITIPSNPSPSESLAAEELAAYISRMSGANLSIRKGGEPSDKALIIAESDNLGGWRILPEGVKVEGEEYAIAPVGDRVFLVGGRGRSTIYAVYDFLDRLGCSFLAPEFDHYQGSAEIIPNSPTLSIDLPGVVREKPVLPIRKLYVEEGRSHTAENLARMIEWMPKARFNWLVIPTDYQGGGRVRWDNWREKIAPELRKRDIVIEVGGHGYQNFLNADMEDGRLFAEHSEWFGLDVTGKRSPAKAQVLCISNEDARGYLIRNFLEYIKVRPEIEVYSFWPPDGARWCTCENCAEIGSPADQQAYLLAKVKSAVAEVRPDLRLEIIAYASAAEPPTRHSVDSDVLVDFCPIAQCFEVQINDPASGTNSTYLSRIEAWRKSFSGDISVYSYYRKYAWRSLPCVIPHYMKADLAYYMTLPVQGISSYAEPGDWFTYELNHYVLGRLAWNPSADVVDLVRKFCEARYPSMPDKAVSAFRTLEEVVRRNGSIPGTKLKSVEELDRALVRLEVSRDELNNVKTSSESEQRNIGRLLLMIEYALRDIAIQRARSEGDSTKAGKLVGELHEFLVEQRDAGVFLIHSRLDLDRLRETYAVAK